MKQRRINATLKRALPPIAALVLTTLLILTTLPQASITAPRLGRQPLESLTTLNSTEVTERGAPLSAFSAPPAASVVQSPGTTTRVSAALRNSPVMFMENMGQSGPLKHSIHNDNPFFIAITSDHKMYAFPLLDQPHQGYFIDNGSAAAVADFDNDGYCEVLAARSTDRFLRLYESDGGTGFIEKVVSNDAYPSTDFFLGVLMSDDSAVGDFDNNHLLDFAFAGKRCPSASYCPPGGQGLIQLHLNYGNGRFDRRSIDINGVSDRPYERMAGLDDGDFNIDGFPDLAAQQYWCGADNITHLLLGNGNGTFMDSTAFTNANSRDTLGLVSGDFNNDGYLDLIVGQDDDGDPGQTWLYLGNGTGGFTYFGPAYDTNPADETGSDRPGAGYSDAYDFDSDGNLDVIAAAGNIGLLLFKGNGDGSFQAPLMLNSGANWRSIATPPESQPPCKWPTPFLDLPFEYTNFAEAAFGRIGDRGPGRVRSWFDHTYPDYGLNTDGRNILTIYTDDIYTGTTNIDVLTCNTGVSCYDGHNGLDFSPHTASASVTETILAAAGGVVTDTVTACNDDCRYRSCSECGVYGNYVLIDHENDYATRYAHLVSVSVTETTRVNSRDILGIMGNTGKSTGVHLHFSVYYDDDGNGTWEEDEVVDPYGWLGSTDEPWEASGGPATDHWLWIHEVYTRPLVLGEEGATITDTTGHVQAFIPPGCFTGQATFELSPRPVAGVSAQLRSSGHSFWLRLLEWLPGGGGLQSATTLQSTAQFILTQPITFTVTYTDTDVLHLDVSQLALHRWDEEQETWQPLTTTVDLANHVVTAQTQDLGDFDLQAPLLCATDDLEPDDGYAAARRVWPNDWPLARGLDIPQDSDWSRFDAVQGVTYTISTQNLAAGADTVLNLYDVDALTLLDSNDDAGEGPASELVWTAPYTGTFFVETVTAPGSTTDCSATYELTIATISGDVIADCQVDIADIMQVASHWRCKCGDACYHSLYDLDGDCIITVVDIMKVVVHWGESCE